MTKVGEVNIGFGDDISQMLYEAAKQTWGNRPGAVVELHRSFSGARVINAAYKPTGCVEVLGTDGVGTKVEAAERTGDHTPVGHDLIAMGADDASVRGAVPIAATNVIDVNRLLENDPETKQAMTGIVTGLVAAASLAKIVIINGEVAELGNRVGGYSKPHPLHKKMLAALLRRQLAGGFNYNWSATILSYAHPERILSGDKIKEGDVLIGLAEEGFRSNGITDVRRLLGEEFGKEWHNEIANELPHATLGQLVQTPSTIYTTFITDLTGGYDLEQEPVADISGVAHITGGGIPSKLGRMLEPSGLGASITHPQQLPQIMEFLHGLSGFSDEKAYGKWHMGSGMIISTSNPQAVLDHALKRGFKAQVIGEVTKAPGIRIVSHGVQKRGEMLTFNR